jgi:hypothetical protein
LWHGVVIVHGAHPHMYLKSTESITNDAMPNIFRMVGKMPCSRVLSILKERMHSQRWFTQYTVQPWVPNSADACVASAFHDVMGSTDHVGVLTSASDVSYLYFMVPNNAWSLLRQFIGFAGTNALAIIKVQKDDCFFVI